jgi:hypothetical protein
MLILLTQPWRFRDFKFSRNDVLDLTPFRASSLIAAGRAIELEEYEVPDHVPVFHPEKLRVHAP